jgi:hypothetical protein
MFRSPSLSSGQPRNRPAGHVVTAANLRKRFLTVIAACDRLTLLVVGELRHTPHSHALRLGAFAAFADARADHIARCGQRGAAGRRDPFPQAGLRAGHGKRPSDKASQPYDLSI